MLTENAGKAAPARRARSPATCPTAHEACPVGSDRALDSAIITAPEARDPALLRKLDAVAGRVLKGVSLPRRQLLSRSQG